MKRDLRDPIKLGKRIFELRNSVPDHWPLSRIADECNLYVEDYAGDGFMSSNPADHHSKTRQDKPVESE